jgi:DNA-binding response OmpR family regulator
MLQRTLSVRIPKAMNRRIYILEDDPDIGLVLTYFLIEEGFEVELFETVDTCQNAINVKAPDLCLFDIMLPDGDGIAICNRIKENHETSTIPVILMSAGEKPSTVYQKSNADIFIAKPFDLDDLLNNIHQLLN